MIFYLIAFYFNLFPLSSAVMKRDAKLMRGDGPTVFAQVKFDVGVDEILTLIQAAFREATSTQKNHL